MYTQQIKLISGLCGSGKTTTRLIPQTIEDINNKRKVCIVVPSTELQTQIQNDLSAYNINAVVINSNSSSAVTEELMKMFGPLSYQFEGRVLIITHAAYFLASPYIDTTDWVFHWDELPSESSKIVYNKNIKALESVDHNKFTNIDPITNRCTLNDAYKKDVRLNNQSDAFKTLYSALQSSNTEVYLDSESDVAAAFTVIYKPSFFPNDITFYGANVEHSLFYKIMKHFNPSLSIEHLSNKNNNHNSSRIKIVSSTNVEISKYLQENNMEGFRNIIKPLINKIGNNNCLVLSNKISADLEEFNTPNMLRVSHNVHGINNLSHYNHVLLTSALNRGDSYEKLMEKFGIDDFDIRIACTIETYYQVAARTSLRNNEALTEDLYIYTPNHMVAKMMKEYVFPNAELIEVDNVIIKRTRTKKETSNAMSPTNKSKLSRMRKILKNNPEAYPPYVVKALTTFTGSKAKEIVSLPWFSNYSSNGVLK